MGRRADCRCTTAVLVAVLALAGCSGPKPPEPVELGPAAVISIDTVSAGPGTVEVPIRLTYMPDGRDRMDSLGAFQFLISFDTTVLEFTGEFVEAEATHGWMIIPFHGDPISLCDDCPLRGVRLRGLRGRSRSGTNESQGYPEGIIAAIKFTVPYDEALSGVSTAVSFHSYSCTDNTLWAGTDQPRLYISDPAFGPVSTEATVDTTTCSDAYVFEPILAFEAGAVRIEEFDRSPLAAIITVESATVSAWSDFYLPITLSYPDDVIQEPVRIDMFDLLLDYDAAGLDLIGVVQGDDISSWEYFTWRRGWSYCHNCPSQAFRVMALHDMNDGVTPSPIQNHPEGTIAKLHFAARGSSAPRDTTRSVWFFSSECGNNLLADGDHGIHYLPDPYDPLNDPRVLDTCSGNPYYHEERALRFCNGTVTVEGSDESPPIVAIIALDSIHTSPGAEFDVPLRMWHPKPELLDTVSFDVIDCTIVYDQTAMRFLNAVEQGPAISEWNFFGWTDSMSYAPGDWPANAVRVVSVRMMGGGYELDSLQRLPEGIVATLRFQATADAQMAGRSYDIGFASRTCGENLVVDMVRHVSYIPHPDYIEGDQRAVCDPSYGSPQDSYSRYGLGFHSGRVFIDAP